LDIAASSAVSIREQIARFKRLGPWLLAGFFAASFLYYRLSAVFGDPTELPRSAPAKAVNFLYFALFVGLLIWLFIDAGRIVRQRVAALGKSAKLVLLLILLFAAALRFHALTYGLPQRLHYDEVQNTFRGELFQRHPDNVKPASYAYPSTLYYLVALSATARSTYDGIRGEPFVREQSSYSFNRALMALLGVVAVLLVFLLATEAGFGEAGGVLAALAAAASPLLVDYAHFTTPESPLLLFSVLAAWYCLIALNSTDPRWAPAAAAVGMAIGSKYNAAPVALVLLGAVLLHPNRPARRQYLVRAALIMLAALIICAPYVLLDSRNFILGALKEMRHYSIEGHAGYEGQAGLPNLLFQIRFLCREGFGLAPILLTALGVVGGLCCRRRATLLLALTPLLTFLAASTVRVTFDRIMLPAIPFLAALGGASLLFFGAAPERLRSSRLLAALLVALAACLYPAYLSWTGWTYRALPDTRRFAADWIGKQLPTDARVAVDPVGPDLRFLGIKPVSLGYSRSSDLTDLRRQHVAYVALNMWAYGRQFTRASDPARRAAWRKLLADLQAGDPSNPVAVFLPRPGSIPGPRIDIYRLPASLAAP